MKFSDIRGLWKKKKDIVEESVNSEENIGSVDMLTDSPTVNFVCASSSSQSKKKIMLSR